MKSSLGFDPRDIPWIVQEGQWPALPVEVLQAEALKRVFENPPEWTPEVKKEPALAIRPPKAAAVLVPIVLRGPQGSDPHLLLTQRTHHLSSHAGQIAFPGGKVDDEDASIEHTALREAEEEVGLAPHFVEILGTLPSYVTGTSFHITPVVGLVSPNHVITPNPQEVDAVFEVPLTYLMNPINHRYHQWQRDGISRYWYSMPYLESSIDPSSDPIERYIWGATAGMIRNFYRFILAANSL